MGKRNQGGMSALGMLVVLAVAGFLLTVGFKVGPLFLDNYFVNGALQALADDNVHEMTPRNIRKKVSQSFTLNNVRDIDTKLIKIERQKTRTLVSLNYEKRVNFAANVDIVVTFDNVYDSSL